MMTGSDAERGRLVLEFAVAAAVLTLVCAAGAAARTTARSLAHHRAVQRRALIRALHRNPRIALRKSFLHQAQLLGADLPVTIRLTPVAGTPVPNNNAISINLDPAVTAAPMPVGVSAGAVTSNITGTIAATMRFSQDSAGAGKLGVVSLGIGQINLKATGFPLINDATPATCSLLKTADSVQIVDAPNGAGLVSLFGGVFSLDLRTAFQFSSQTRATCAGTFTQTSLMDGTGRPPLPMQIDGSLGVSPDVTNDGYVRLAKLTLTGTQQNPLVQVHTCTAGPAPPSTCAAGSDSMLTGRLVVTTFNADLLIGTVSA